MGPSRASPSVLPAGLLLQSDITLLGKPEVRKVNKEGGGQLCDSSELVWEQKQKVYWE